MSCKGQKILWEKEEMLVTSISSFSHNFSKDLCPQVDENSEMDCKYLSLTVVLTGVVFLKILKFF